MRHNLHRIEVLLTAILAGANPDVWSQTPNIRVHPNPSMQQFETSIATHPSDPNIVLIGAVTQDPYSVDVNAGTMGWYYTTDGGQSWSGRDTLPTHANLNQFMGDPSVGIDESGRLLVAGLYNDANIFVDRSTDGGGSWSHTVAYSIVSGQHTPAMAQDLSPQSTYKGNIYLASTGVVISRSTNGGSSFSAPVNISGTVGSSGRRFPRLAVGPDGKVFATWPGYDAGSGSPVRLGLNTSTDGGVTWGTARSIRSYNGVYGQAAIKGTQIYSGPTMAVDRSAGPRRGWIYIAYAEKNPSFPDILLIRSTDGGTTWSDPVKVNGDMSGNDHWMPAITVDPTTGFLSIVYYDSRNFPANDSAQVYMSWSLDGGNSFQDVLVSDAPFRPAPISAPWDNDYMGQYLSIAALDSVVWPCWMDNRTGSHQVYASRVVLPPAPSEPPVQSSGPELWLFPDKLISPRPSTQQFEVSVAVHPTDPNIVLAAWNSIDTSVSTNRTGWSYTLDGGQSWTGKDTLPTHLDPAIKPMVDHTAAIDADGTFFISGFYGPPPSREVFVARSADSGSTWAQTTMTNSQDADKLHTAIDVNPGSPFRSKIYTAYTASVASAPPPVRSIHSTDGGQTFSPAINLSGSVTGTGFPFGVNLSVSEDSVVYASWVGLLSGGIATAGNVPLGFNMSTDGGQSWGTASTIRQINNIGGLSKGGNPIRAWSYPSMGVDRSNGSRRGTIYLAYSANKPPDVFLIRSTDRGLTWSTPMKVNQDKGNTDQWQSWLSIDPKDGTVYIVYYDSRNFAGNDSTEVFVSVSSDGGDTFTEMRVSDQPFLPKSVRHQVLTNYMGSYIGISAVNGIAWAVWNDNRTGFQQVYAARIENKTTGVRQASPTVPSSIELSANYPNPFNPTTHFEFRIADVGFVRIAVFDILGREVAVLVNEGMIPGTYETTWNATGMPSGLYFYRMEAASVEDPKNVFVRTRKMVLVK